MSPLKLRRELGDTPLSGFNSRRQLLDVLWIYCPQFHFDTFFGFALPLQVILRPFPRLEKAALIFRPQLAPPGGDLGLEEHTAKAYTNNL